MSGRIEFTSLTEEEEAITKKRKSGEITPLKDLAAKKQDFRNRTEGLQLIVLVFVIASFCITVALAVEIVIGESQVHSHAGVASLNKICSNIGVSLLKKNANAVDAAIATYLCIMVVEPEACGLGGGGFMLIHDHNSKAHSTTALDFRETAPKNIANAVDSADTNIMNYMDPKIGLRVGVPGSLRGIYKAHSMHGRLHLNDVFAPVIRLAEEGFQVSARLARKLREKVPPEGDYPASFRSIFVNPKTDKLYNEGETMRRRDLADLLRKIVRNGVSIFYNGSIAEEIVNEVRKNGGVMTLEDLNNYRVEERDPLIGIFQEYSVITMPAPSSGSLLLYLLNQVENIAAETATSPNYLSTLAKMTMRAYRCRSLLGDPMDTSKVLMNEKLISNKTLLAELDMCEKLKDLMAVEDKGTSHISVIDKDEMLVSFTSSLNNLFGSQIVTPSGILLNDEMLDFSNPEHSKDKYNLIAPNKRPLSSMIPTIVFQEARPCLLRFSVGGINSTRIVSNVAQTIINMIKFDMSPKEAVDSPKIFCDNSSCEIENFDQVEDVAKIISSKTGIENIKVVDEKLAGIGVTSKFKTNVDAYFEESIGGKASQY